MTGPRPREAVNDVYYAEEKAEVDRYKAVITFLAKDGAPIDLRTAIALGDADQVKKLVKRNPVRPEPAMPPEMPVLHLAVRLDQKDIVTALLDGGVPIEGADEDGYTALHDAAFSGRAEIAKVLIGRGAKIEARTTSGATPLSEAARGGCLAVARGLLAAGAAVNAKDDGGMTPLGNAKKSDSAMIGLRKMNGGQ